jgi:hypothetical protein
LHLEVGSFPLGRIVSLFIVSIGGPKATLGSAVACGILLSVFEGIGVLLSRTMGEANRPVAPMSAFLVLFSLTSLTSKIVEPPPGQQSITIA